MGELQPHLSNYSRMHMATRLNYSSTHAEENTKDQEGFLGICTDAISGWSSPPSSNYGHCSGAYGGDFSSRDAEEKGY